MSVTNKLRTVVAVLLLIPSVSKPTAGWLYAYYTTLNTFTQLGAR